MTFLALAHFVFVDFENVPSINLGLVVERPVHVTLLVGKNQKKLEVGLVQQALQLGPRIRLVPVGASGHNALDLTLAYYLGQSAQQHPGAEFYIVSKDQDFDPLIAHAKASGLAVSRHGSFEALPFLPQPKKSSAAKPAAPEETTAAPDRLEKLIARLKNHGGPRPKKKASLLARIKTDFGGKIADEEAEEKLTELLRLGVVAIDPAGKVSYS